MKNSSFVFALFLVLLQIGCGNYKEVKTSQLGAQGFSDKDLQVDFAMIKSEILTPYCISCHIDGQHSSYGEYSVAKLLAGSMLQRINETDTTRRMPQSPLPALPKKLKILLEAWINSGTPEFIGEAVEELPEAPALSFVDIRDKVFKPNNCIKCHSQLNDYGTTKNLLPTIVSLVSNNRMPFPMREGQKVTPVTDAVKQMLEDWLAQGAPEFADRESEPLEAVVLEPTWVSLRNNVLGPKCILCHNSFGPRAPTSMSTYTDLMTWYRENPSLFDFNNPEESHFVGSMIGRVDEDEFFFDAMPFNNDFDDVSKVVDPVTPKELEIIKKWIGLKLPFNNEEI